MALLAVEGVYENGKVELAEEPQGLERARGVVTFLPDEAVPEAADAEDRERTRREAGERMLARMRQGIDFGGEKFNRDEIYEERMRELDARRNARR